MAENAVVYARYSSRGQQEQSIEGQLAAAKKYAEEHGYTIIHAYCDHAKTGTNDNREAFQQMLADCAKKQFTVIIVWKVDRFGRNRQEITFNKYRAKKHGVRVEYVAERVSDGPEGVILESVLEGMAEYYSLQLSQNVKRGLLESAKKHHVIGGQVPLGFKIGADKSYEIDPDTAPIVKKIFEMYASGSTSFEVMHYLNSHGYRTRRGTEFTKNVIPRMLSNERYVGTYIYKDVIREENAIPAIIDRETFDKVQKMLAVNKRAPSHKWAYSDYLLSEKLFCGKCGSPMSGMSGKGKSGRKFSYYACTKRRKENSCDKKNVRQDVIEEAVLHVIKQAISDTETIEFIADKVWEYYATHEEDTSEADLIRKKIKDAQNGILSLVKAIEMGIIDESIKERMEALRAEKTALEASLAELELPQGPKLTKDMIRYFLYRFKDMDLTDRKLQRRLVETFVNSIYLYDDKFTINLNYGGSEKTVTLAEMESSSADANTLLSVLRSNTFAVFGHVISITIKLPEW